VALNLILKNEEKYIMKKKFLSILSLVLILTGIFTGCANNKTDSLLTAETTAKVVETTSATTKTKLIGLTDLVPHSELIEFIKPQLEAQGIEIELVGTAADATWNEKLDVGDVDFNFFQHLPYLEEYNETNGTNLVSAGYIHVEPIAAYSEKYTKVEEIPENAKVVVPNDATNEYRALRILEIAGFIKLNPDLPELKASVADIVEYIKPIEITEIDSTQIIGLAKDFDVYIVNTNKAIEAGVDTSKFLFKEGEDSPYANIIAVKAEKANDPAIKALVKALQSDETRKFIEEKYNGAVIPAKID
jgi:D-methionine transport system substrate-binding protein